jgi:Eco57I restriction-modification methylase
MPILSTDLRSKLERTAIAARNLAEKASRAALDSLAVQRHEPYGHMTSEQRNLRNKLRAHARQLGDTQDSKGQLSIKHLAQECAYEHWHRMLFARFLAENNLLIEPAMRVAVSLDDCKELAKEAKTDLWTLAGRFAQTMLPEIFPADDPVLQVTLAREDQLKLEQLLDALPAAVFTASDSLGWCYQFWQAQRKKEVNDSGVKIGADELPAVTQLFTEDYMVDFLLDNTLGAWHAGKMLDANPKLAENAKTEEELRKAVALPGVLWKYLRFIKDKDGQWLPTAGVFDRWPKTAKELKCLDPCMGSGHFVVAMFDRLVALRMAEEKLDEKVAVAAVINENLFGLEIDPRCTQIGAFNLALVAWRRVGYCVLPPMNLACSGLAPNTKKDDWTKLAEGNANLRFAMGALYDLFQKAPLVGSLINPHRDKATTYLTTLAELQPLLDVATKREKADDAHELAVTARGLAKAAEMLANQFTLVATNVPYLGRGRQDELLIDYCDNHHLLGKADLATCFIERLTEFCTAGSTAGFVTKQEWLFLGKYGDVRRRSLQDNVWVFAVRLGPRAFETISGERVNVSLHAITKSRPNEDHEFFSLDVSAEKTPSRKAQAVLDEQPNSLSQSAQLKNPDSRVTTEAPAAHGPTFSSVAESYQGIVTGDLERFRLCVWEVPQLGSGWVPFRTTVSNTGLQDGCYSILLWEGGSGKLHRYAQETRDQLHDMHESGNRAWQRRGIALNRMSGLQATLYYGEHFDNNVAVLIPREESTLAAFLAYCSSPSFEEGVKKLDRTLKITNRTLIKVPFDLGHWEKMAAKRYPHGLPKPFSTDPTQWLFNGQLQDSEQPLHVAVARLLGYQWPRQTGSSFPDCPALGPDGLEKLADDDGIVCLPSVRGKEPAAERLRKLLAVAFGRDWKAQTELELIRASGSEAADLEEWLRNDFFEQHCDLFHQRPFVWHIWDGRKRDGFHALVNYHALVGEKGKGRRVLESLTHSYLGNDWITRQKDSLKRGEEGADERVAAALALKERLEAIIEGKPPFDIFVRWKPLNKQAIGWGPDINDGVRMNIRPFLASDLPNGKKGAGILRSKPNIKWEKDRGNEPQRPKEDFPWFWKDGKFTGDRVNDVHLTKEQKEKASKR